jgi:3-hydroxy-9,10-secoandrosta-1,3,5(10)-triene-9,17-dione monooxygenase
MKIKESKNISVPDRVAYRHHSATVTETCTRIIDDLMAATGGRAIFKTHKINLFFQAIHAARAHYANNPLNSSRNYGGIQIGLESTDFFI